MFTCLENFNICGVIVNQIQYKIVMYVGHKILYPNYIKNKYVVNLKTCGPSHLE
jgi:hypothetical protein